MKKRVMSVLLILILVLSVMPTAWAAMPAGDTVLATHGSGTSAITISKDSTGKTVTVSADASGTVNIVAYKDGKKPSDLDSGGYGDLVTSIANGTVADTNANIITQGTDFVNNTGSGSASVTFPTGQAGDWVIWANHNGAASNPKMETVTIDANGAIATAFAVKTEAVPKQTGKVGEGFTTLDLNDYVEGGSKTYKFELTAGTLPAGLTLNTTGTNNGKITGKPTAATTTDVTVTVKISDNADATKNGTKDVTFAIAKGDQPMTLSAATLTLKEGETKTVTVSNAQGAVTIDSNTDNTKATASISGTTISIEGVAEGSTTVTVKAAGDTNYAAGTKTIAVTVQPATMPTFTVTNNTHTYDGTAKTATVTATVDGADAEVTGVTYGGAANQTNANETGYEIKATVGGKEYTLTEKLVINKKALTISFTGNDAGKTLADVTSSLTGVEDGDTVNATVTWTEVTGTKDVCNSPNCDENCKCQQEPKEACDDAVAHGCEYGKPKTAADFPLTAGSSHAYTVALTGDGSEANYTLADGTMTVPGGGGGFVSSDFTVTYAAGAHGTVNGATSEKVKRNESPVNVPTVTANKGYAFIGWSLDGKTIVNPAAQTITKNTTFTALYGDHLAYMVGRSTTEFVPNGNLTRAEAAAILSRLTEGFEEDGTYPAAPYSDLTAGAWYVKYVNFAADKGIVNGRDNGTFDPDANITRAEFATMIANFAKIAKVDTAAVSTDVAGHWAEGYIAALEQAKVVTGYEDGTFKPNANITRAEAATMVNGAIGRVPMSELDLAANGYVNPFVDVTTSQWFYAQVMEATASHMSGHFHK